MPEPEIYPLPAVVLSSPHHVGLGITRTLGRLGVPVYTVDSTRWAPAFFSKFCSGLSTWDFENAASEESVRFLTSLAGRLGRRSALIPTTDATALFVADHAETLRAFFLFAEQDPALVRALCNKHEMQKLAQRAGIAVPDAAVPRTRAELLAGLEESKLPLIVKSVDTLRRRRKSPTKALVRNPQEANRLYGKIPDEAIGRLMLQEWIPATAASDWIFNGYFDQRSRCLASFTGRKLRQYPPDIGVTSLGITERNQTLEESAIGFLASLRYRGPVDMDFRYDERDQSYKLVDVNPRVGGTFRLFVSAEGLDVARVLYLHQIGQPLSRVRVAEGRKWGVEDYDLVTALRSVCRRRLGVRQWLGSLRRIEEFGFLSMDDPMPALLMLRDDVSELMALLDRARNRVAPFETNPSAASSEISFSNSSAPQGEV